MYLPLIVVTKFYGLVFFILRCLFFEDYFIIERVIEVCFILEACVVIEHSLKKFIKNLKIDSKSDFK